MLNSPTIFELEIYEKRLKRLINMNNIGNIYFMCIIWNKISFRLNIHCSTLKYHSKYYLVIL